MVREGLRRYCRRERTRGRERGSTVTHSVRATFLPFCQCAVRALLPMLRSCPCTNAMSLRPLDPSPSRVSRLSVFPPSAPLPFVRLPRVLQTEAARIRALDAELRRASLPRSPNGGGALAGRGAWAASPGRDPYDDDYGGRAGGGMDPDDDLDALINMENELREAAQGEDIDPDLLAEAEAHTALAPAPDSGPQTVA